jgi:hypothetical protein
VECSMPTRLLPFVRVRGISDIVSSSARTQLRNDPRPLEDILAIDTNGRHVPSLVLGGTTCLDLEY